MKKEKRAKLKDDEHVLLCEIVDVQFRKGSPSLFYKRSFTDVDYTEVDFLKPKFVKSGGWKEFPEMRSEARGIPTLKKEGILACLKGVALEKVKWWHQIALNNNSVDLGVTREKVELIS